MAPAPWNRFKPSSKSIFTDRSKAVLLWWIVFVGYASCWCFILCSLLVTCWERADLLAVVCVLFCQFPKCVLVHIKTRVRLVPWNWLKPFSEIFTDRSKAVLLLWIFYYFFFQSCVCYAYVPVCLNVPCCHLPGKVWPIGSRMWCLTVSLTLSHPGSGVVLDCINSWSLHPYFLYFNCYQ